MTNKPIWSWVEKPKVKFFVFLVLSVCMIYLSVKCFLTENELIGLVLVFIAFFDLIITFGSYLKWKEKF